MTTQGKTIVRKEVKKTGSHAGTVKKALENNGFDYEIYKNFVAECFDSKYNKTKSTIKKTIRFQ